MIGLHPSDVREGFRDELEVLYAELSNQPNKYVAVGEIGLDYYWSRTHESEMNEALRTQLKWAKEFGKPVSLHARDAIMDTVQAIKEVGS